MSSSKTPNHELSDHDSKTAESHQSHPNDCVTFRPRVAPRSLYIHIPFCRHRCGYCNFTLVAGRDHLIERFLDALQTEISWLGDSFELDTIFFGGGTPSHLSPAQLDRLSHIISSRFLLASDAEVTAECNPNDLDYERGEALAKLGVNRISLGVQSLRSKKLESLERDHNVVDIENAIGLARSFCSSVSIDLIFAAPSETLSQWEADLDQAIALAPDHLSTYELTYEKGTQFWNRLNRGQLSQADEELRAQMYCATIDRLSQSGYHQYEVSSFAKPEHRCRHNLVYWKGAPYFAFGPGAAKFVDSIRQTNHQSTMSYLKLIEQKQSPVTDSEQLDPVSSAKERLAIGLRMIDGVDAQQFESTTGMSVEEILGSLAQQLQENGMLINTDGAWRLTAKGILICDWISSEIVG